ncbi:MAG: amino acid adenylation domain-containing protein [Chloroflexota bacterium]
MTTTEHQQVLAKWNSTQADFPDLCVHQLFEAQVEKTPNAIALLVDTEALTYSELNQRANRVAHQLLAFGSQPDDLIAISIERSTELFIGLLGILKAGCAYIPLDTSYPAERIDYMLRDSGANVLLTKSDIATQVDSSVTVLQVNELGCAGKEGKFSEKSGPLNGDTDHPNPDVAVTPRHLAYCIYTSGSTGNPKGALMEHRALCNMLWWHKQTRASTQGVKTLQFCAVSFDFSFHEIFSTLCLGGALVLVPEEVRQNPFALAEFISQQAIEKLFLPVTALLQLAEAIESSSNIPTALREVITTGEQMRITPAVANLFRQTGAMLHNHYGATEFQDATTHTLQGDPGTWPLLVPVGRPIHNVQIYILDEEQQPVPIGEEGEFCIGGVGVSQGYHNRPLLTDEKFILNPFGTGRLYRTGDLARQQPDGTIEHLGRMDHQVKIRGFRVELGEIEAVLARHEAVRESAVTAREIAGDTQLVGYVTLAQKIQETELDATLRLYLEEILPEHMVPTRFVTVGAMPLTPSGKLDRRALPAPAQTRPPLSTPLVSPKTATEQQLGEIWQTHLRLDSVGIHDNFFELGGTSLLLTQAHKSLRDALDINLSAVSLFQYPTIQTLARYIDNQEEVIQSNVAHNGAKSHKKQTYGETDIAIIGMAGRFPDAETIEQFWQNLCDGVESITFFDDNELEQTAPDLLGNPDYVKAGAVLDDIKGFDAAFFGYSPKEAAVTDPQQRILLECAWEAFERAGYNPETYPGSVGVFAGSSLSTYLLNNIGSDLGITTEQPFIETDMAQFQAKIGNDRSYLATRISYKLNLTGPSINVQTACSTSLVAVHMACQSLISGESDMALAGGGSVVVPHKGGYLYEEGMVRSPDGHCRAFDAEAQGTIFGNGGGLVLLKRLQEALDDHDPIVAVIKGTAINNDGGLKVGYTAPSVDGQAAVVSEALAVAEVDASTIGYIEAHGTATKLGDPIEVAGLTQAFRQSSNVANLEAQQCAIGSVKTNIGHLDEAAGIAGLIKAALAVQHGQIPPSLHFSTPNPQINFDETPFFVNTELRKWPHEVMPHRAGVSSFGVGGTNSHVVLEAAPVRAISNASLLPEHHLLTLSAHSQEALQELAQRYIKHLESQPEIELDSLSFTANTGRKHFDHRLAVVADSVEKIQTQLRQVVQPKLRSQQAVPHQAASHQTVALLFTGQGSQYVDMGRQLYESQSIFRLWIDRCDEILRPYLDRPLCSVLYPEPGESSPIHETAYAQPALFTLEYALYQLWKSWGIAPDLVMGHSIGEYVAACVAGVFSLEEGLTFIAERGRLMQALPQNGKMLSVAASEADVVPLLAPHIGQVSIAALNGPQTLVLSGLDGRIDEVATALTAAGVKCKELTVSHAFHSPLMEPMLAEFAQVAQQIAYAAPQIPLVSNVTGQLASDEVATPEYWVSHVSQPVRFFDGMNRVAQMGGTAFVEIGPAPILLGLGRQCLPEVETLWLPSLRPQHNDQQQLLRSLGVLYTHGAVVDWPGLYKDLPQNRVLLPTYPFQRERCWIDSVQTSTRRKEHFKEESEREESIASKKPIIADWFYVPSWRRSASFSYPTRQGESGSYSLLFSDMCGFGEALAQQLSESGQTVITVQSGTEFAQIDSQRYLINPSDVNDYCLLLQALAQENKRPEKIIHLWEITPDSSGGLNNDRISTSQQTGFYSLLFLAQALAQENFVHPLELIVVANGLHAVTGEEMLQPAKATALGICKVIGQEYPNVRGRHVDILLPQSSDQPSGQPNDQPSARVINQLLTEVMTPSEELITAYRGPYRWVQSFEPVRLEEADIRSSRLRAGGVYLIVGGLGDIGLLLAEHIFTDLQAKLILTGRSVFPPREDWGHWLATHDSNDRISRKIQQLQALEARGLELLILSADVADQQEMAMVIERAEEHFGDINGVIHSVMHTGANALTAIEETNQAICYPHFQGKIHGTVVLSEVLQNKQLDFCLLMSSIASILGGVEYAAYTAANLFMDHFVHLQNRRSSTPWFCVNWDEWDIKKIGARREEKSLAEYAINPAEGVEILTRVLSLREPGQIIISSGALQERIDRWLKLESLQSQSSETDDPLSAFVSLREELENVSEQERSEILRDHVCDQVAHILGVDTAILDMQTGFFTLGMDSLTSIELRNNLQTSSGVSLSPTMAFDYPTVEAVVAYLTNTMFPDESSTPQDNGENTNATLPDLKQLSESDIEALLLQELENINY